jgi:Domain of unknown function (DUF1906)
MRRTRAVCAWLLVLCAVCAVTLLLARVAGTSVLRQAGAEKTSERTAEQTYLGFDANEYPGDDVLPELRKTFSFSGYWLNVPPGAKVNPWMGTRAALVKNGFGFLVLFNGRLAKELQEPVNAGDLGTRDADEAVAAARREGFAAGTVLFLDIEEGGRMLASQIDYIKGWKDRVDAQGFAAGVYCSGMKVKEGKGQTITTADDIQERVPVAAYFIYNDACPPSPGCAYMKSAPAPSRSGFAGARVWQFAQSPRRRSFTGRCAGTYGADGNCYAPGAGRVLLDLDSAVVADPSTVGR